MQIQVSRLRDLMELLKPAVPKKTTLAVTRYIHLGQGKAVATDLESMIVVDLPEAQEEMLLPYFSLADAVKFIPGDAMLSIETSGKKELALSWPGGEAKYPTETPMDFPLLPDLKVRAESDINGDIFIPAILAALPYVSTDQARPVLTGVTLVLGNPIEVAAGDGFRMSHQVLGLSFPLEEKIIVPAHSVTILGHVFAKTPRPAVLPVVIARRPLHISLSGENKLMVNFGSAAVVVNLIQGTPPEFIQLIPKGEPILQSLVFAPQLEAAVKRVRAIARDNEGIIRLEFANGKLMVSAKDEDRYISVSLDTISTMGEPGRTAVNYTYLADYLSGKQGIITISQYNKTGPISFQYQTSPRVLIMPMFVDWGDEKPGAPEKLEPVAEQPETSDETAEGATSLEEQLEKEPEETAALDDAVIAEQEASEEPPAIAKPKRRRKQRVPGK